MLGLFDKFDLKWVFKEKTSKKWQKKSRPLQPARKNQNSILHKIEWLVLGKFNNALVVMFVC